MISQLLQIEVLYLANMFVTPIRGSEHVLRRRRRRRRQQEELQNCTNVDRSTMSTKISLDAANEAWNYLSPVPPNVPTTGEDSAVIAPWLDETAVSFTIR